MAMSGRPRRHILLCAPRGFCAGVERAIQIVEEALERFGAPVYVRHEIVHNRFVVEALKAKGAIFVEELEEISDASRPVVFSAHGVARSVTDAARGRSLFSLDATCPLVAKVHKEAILHDRRGRKVVLIGHAGHPEVDGTMGQLPPGAAVLVETVEDARAFEPQHPGNLAWITQTTLSVDDTAEIVAVLRERFPDIVGPHKEDICYATTNRQEAVKRAAPLVQRMIVVGSPNSSNSQRLREVAERAGCPKAVLVDCADEIDWSDFTDIERIGITAGASAPESLVEAVIEAFAARYEITVELVRTSEENITFSLPKALRKAAAA
jgi:4-hydroxy-3-methylbut-2-enyl diphosphate reductase